MVRSRHLGTAVLICPLEEYRYWNIKDPRAHALIFQYAGEGASHPVEIVLLAKFCGWK